MIGMTRVLVLLRGRFWFRRVVAGCGGVGDGVSAQLFVAFLVFLRMVRFYGWM